jgi:threonine synthase
MHFSLRCHLCQTVYPAEALWVCSQCLGPLEVTCDYAAIAPLVSRELIGSRPRNLWRYRELLPIAGEPRTGLHSGFLRSSERSASPPGSGFASST